MITLLHLAILIHMKKSVFNLYLLPVITVALLAACSSGLDQDVATPTEENIQTVPAASSTPDGSEGIASAVPTRAVGRGGLRIWVPAEFLEPEVDGASSLLQQQVEQYALDQSVAPLFIEAKAVSGHGGLLEYLKSGRSVAPSIMPDLVLVPSSLLHELVANELVVPSAALVGEDPREDLFEAAVDLATVEDELVALPYLLDGLQHMAFDREAITGTIPSTWNGMIDIEGANIVLAGAGRSGAELLLALYGDAGGTTRTADGRIDLQVQPLTGALNLIADGRQVGTITVRSSNVDDLGEAWSLFDDGMANIVQTSTDYFLGEWSAGSTAGFAPIPGFESEVRPTVTSWMWVVTTPVPEAQDVAIGMAEWLSMPEQLATWSLQHARIPARRSALELWPRGEPYVDFLLKQLDRAIAFPHADEPIVEALRIALFDVVSPTSKPAQLAAEQAVATLRQ